MSDTYTPTMNDVKIWLCEPQYAGGLFDDETAAKFDAALAAHDAEVAAKAWDEGRRQGIADREYAQREDGYIVIEATPNPYRIAESHDEDRVRLRHADGTPKTNDEIRARAAEIRGGHAIDKG